MPIGNFLDAAGAVLGGAEGYVDGGGTLLPPQSAPAAVAPLSFSARVSNVASMAPTMTMRSRLALASPINKAIQFGIPGLGTGTSVPAPQPAPPGPTYERAVRMSEQREESGTSPALIVGGVAAVAIAAFAAYKLAR